jgi:hypothetical protein
MGMILALLLLMKGEGAEGEARKSGYLLCTTAQVAGL